MKKIFSLLLMAFALSVMACSAEDDKLQGVYLTEDYNTMYGDTLTQVTYTFIGDSLYIDTYPSGCFVAAMSLRYSPKVENSPRYMCDATETIYDIETGRHYKRVYHLSFCECEWNSKSLAVFRDYKVVDIITPSKMPIARLEIPN
jgi:hypothetical protein